MTISESVALLRACVRNGNSSTMYPADVMHHAIMNIGNDFVARTWPVRLSGDLTLAANSNALPSFSGLTSFLPRRLIKAYISGLTAPPPMANGQSPSLAVVPYQELYAQIVNNTALGMPSKVAFETETTGIVGPEKPDQSYTLRLVYDCPFNSWTAGSTDNTVLGASIIVTEDLWRPALRFAGPTFLQGIEPQSQVWVRDSWAQYLDFVQQVKSRGPSGGALVRNRSFPSTSGRSSARRVLIDPQFR